MKQLMELTFLGTGTSGGVPDIGCDCETCTSNNPKDKRLRSSVYIKTDNCALIIDSSIDLRQQFLREKISALDAVLFTHTHADHVLGLDDLRSVSWRQNKAIQLYAAKTELEEIKRIFPYLFGNLLQEGGGVVQVGVNEIDNEEFHISDLQIMPLSVMHGKLDIKGYKINDKLAYITDASHLPHATIESIENIDTLIINALRYREHSTHFNIEQCLNMVKKIQAKRAFLIHMTHDVLHDKTQSELPENVFLSYDGLKIVV